MTNKFVILLRGINVGGNNIIKMADLRASVENLGYLGVKTYIQTGNILLSTQKNKQQLEKDLEKMLRKQFDYTLPILVLSEREFNSIIDEAPKSFGSEPKKFRYDVWFLIPPLTATKAEKEIELREGVDTMKKGRRALYTTRLIAKASQSRLSKMVQKKVYQSITIRNWNTTTKLQALLSDLD